MQSAQDPDIDAEISSILASRPDDLALARSIRAGELGKTTGAGGPNIPGKPEARPVKAFFFRGSTDRRALVIAGVHGSERQGMEVVELLLADLRKAPQPPVFSVIVVPTMFPDSRARGDELAKAGKTNLGLQPARESGVLGKKRKKDKVAKEIATNRNFPVPSQDLAAASAAGKAAGEATAIDELGNVILPENQMLMALMERFQPERIITVHGTHDASKAGVFYDKRALRADEKPEPWRPTPRRSQPTESEGYGEAALRDDLAAHEKQSAAATAQRTATAAAADKDLSLKAAAEIDKKTAGFASKGRAVGKHPSVAGNVGTSGKLDNAIWADGAPEGTSLGEYASARGMSVFTVEPPLNYRSDDPAKQALSKAERITEMQAYADAIRTILLGK
jgi:hypothetical protein